MERALDVEAARGEEAHRAARGDVALRRDGRAGSLPLVRIEGEERLVDAAFARLDERGLHLEVGGHLRVARLVLPADAGGGDEGVGVAAKELERLGRVIGEDGDGEEALSGEVGHDRLAVRLPRRPRGREETVVVAVDGDAEHLAARSPRLRARAQANPRVSLARGAVRRRRPRVHEREPVAERRFEPPRAVGPGGGDGPVRRRDDARVRRVEAARREA